MNKGPLNDITVIDLTRVLAGPFCTMTLGELGAKIIKVEAPGKGDDSRQYGPFLKGKSAYFMSLNRGKKSIALDLKDEGDRNIFEGLIKKADVLVENFRPGAMDRLGYGWDDLHARHPRLIYAATSGFGQTGPLAKRPAYDLVIQAMGGIMSLTGQPQGPPARVGTSLGDLAAGLYTALGVCAALYQRQLTGQGVMVDVSMLDCQVAFLENAIARMQADGRPPEPLGSRHPSITPFDLFQAADGPLVIAAGNDQLFSQLCHTLAREDLVDDSRFKSNDLRTQNQAILAQEINRALSPHPRAWWLEALDKAGVPCGPINNVAQVMEHPQVNARNMIVSVDDPVVGNLAVAGNPIKISSQQDESRRAPAPGLDEDREEILKEFG